MILRRLQIELVESRIGVGLHLAMGKFTDRKGDVVFPAGEIDKAATGKRNGYTGGHGIIENSNYFRLTQKVLRRNQIARILSGRQDRYILHFFLHPGSIFHFRLFLPHPLCLLGRKCGSLA